MQENHHLRDHMFEIIDTQMKENDPPETKVTYNRLLKEGFDEFVTKQMIGQCLAIEIFGALKYGDAYDNDRYIKNLNALPNEPFDE